MFIFLIILQKTENFKCTNSYLDVESINKENEFIVNNFNLKIKTQSEHCIILINIDNVNRDYQAIKYSKEFHIY